MADYDPGHQSGAWDGNEGYEVADGNQTEHIQQHSTDQVQAQYSLDPTQHASGDPPSSDGATDDVGDYDPESVNSAPVETQVPLRSSPQRAAKKKPRTVGGFLVGDSDSEDDEARSLQHSISIKTAQDTGAPSNASSAPQVNADATASAGGMENGNTAAPPAPQASTRSEPQAPVDKIAQLEGRIRDDTRGALDAWLALIAEHRSRNDVEQARQTYERFFAVFPQAADVWVEYLAMELEMNNFPEAELIFNKSLMSTPNVNLWTKYLDYIRRRNDLNDSSGNARQTVSRAYEFVIDNIGLDKDAGKIWAEYIQFIKFGPGTVGGSQWQDQQKMDQLRKAYQRAICVPIANVNTLWKEYDQFEMGLNKLTGRKYLAEKSPSYMSAKSANTALENITRGLQRTTLPRLPPAPGFDGDQEYMEQVDIWKRWIAWEKSDPLDLKDDKDQPGLYQKRILYVFNQALMALRFWPEMWVDAAQWCFDNNITSKDGSSTGLDFLTRGIEANPESVLLALKHGDYIESTYPIEENEEAKIARGKAVRAPYDKVLDTLYGIIKGLKDREAAQIAAVEEAAKAAGETSANKSDEDDDDEDEAESSEKGAKDNVKIERLRAIQQGFAAQTQLLSKTISFVWIALIRAMRRVQGKGKPNTELGGMRQAFQDARHRGRILSEVYVAAAQLEWTIYKDAAGGKIFDRGGKLFPDDEYFALENIKFLHSKDDFTNARVLFETVVSRFTQKPEHVHKAKPLYAYFHKYESQFGELAQIALLEKRMAELFPEDPKLAHFSARFSTDKFDPIAARIIVSPTTQLRPKQLIPSIEQGTSLQNSPRPPPFAARHSPPPPFLPATNSPKRPLTLDDFDEPNPPRKIQRNDYGEFQRGASPLKGAAGRRLDQQRRMQGQGAAAYSSGPAPIARDITFLLGQIPRADLYDHYRLNPVKMTNLLRDTPVPEYSAWKNTRQTSDYPSQYGFPSRDSPVPTGVGRPMSPYTGEGARGRMPPASAPYRQSSLRPGSSGSYEPPPAGYAQAAHPPPQGQYNVPPQGQYDAGAVAWGAYPPPPPHLGYGQGPPPPQGGYPRYY
ncbi:mRNA 3'-end-processing protein rna14 [Madurella fahalii]|uniref:mRNA 3'-end-processing protein RNA14 n=1 Tax=Madurella fahalii TaxID=1157608 RepID=A0ABQ0GII6_9PEZI